MNAEESARATLEKYGYKLTWTDDDGGGIVPPYCGYDVTDKETGACYLGKEQGATIQEVWAFILRMDIDGCVVDSPPSTEDLEFSRNRIIQDIRTDIERYEDLRHAALDRDDTAAAEEYEKELLELHRDLEDIVDLPASEIYTPAEDPLDILIAMKNEYEAADGTWPPPELSLDEFWGVEDEKE